MSPELDACLHFILLFCAIILYALNHKRNSVFTRLAVLYIAVTVVFDGVAAAIWLTDFLSGIVTNNLFVYHILTPLQYTIFMLMFSKVVKKHAVKRWMLYSIPAFWIISVLFTLFVQPLDEYPTYGFLVKYLLIIPVILYLLMEILNDPDDYVLTREPVFWIGTGFLFHSVGSVFAQGISNELIKHSDPLFLKLNDIYSVLNYILFACFIVAFVSRFKFSGSERSLDSY